MGRQGYSSEFRRKALDLSTEGRSFVSVAHRAIEVMDEENVPIQVAGSGRVKRDFSRARPNQLWVTDFTEHPTMEGKVYYCVILDTYSRRHSQLRWSTPIDFERNRVVIVAWESTHCDYVKTRADHLQPSQCGSGSASSSLRETT